jgi:hypothetical protein
VEGPTRVSLVNSESFEYRQHSLQMTRGIIYDTCRFTRARCLRRGSDQIYLPRAQINQAEGKSGVPSQPCQLHSRNYGISASLSNDIVFTVLWHIFSKSHRVCSCILFHCHIVFALALMYTLVISRRLHPVNVKYGAQFWSLMGISFPVALWNALRIPSLICNHQRNPSQSHPRLQ